MAVDACTDDGGGHNVGGVYAGEWLEYTVDVKQAGAYAVDLRVSSPGGGGTLHVDFNGEDLTGPVPVPDTNDWLRWQTVTAPRLVHLNAGRQRMRVAFDAAGGVGAAPRHVCNLNWIEVRAVGRDGSTTRPSTSPVTRPTTSPTTRPATQAARPVRFRGTPAVVPGVIQVENFDDGGEAVAYHDTTPANESRYPGRYREGAVDVHAAGPETGGETSVGQFRGGKWQPPDGVYTESETAVTAGPLLVQTHRRVGGDTMYKYSLPPALFPDEATLRQNAAIYLPDDPHDHARLGLTDEQVRRLAAVARQTSGPLVDV